MTASPKHAASAMWLTLSLVAAPNAAHAGDPGVTAFQATERPSPPHLQAENQAANGELTQSRLTAAERLEREAVALWRKAGQADSASQEPEAAVALRREAQALWDRATQLRRELLTTPGAPVKSGASDEPERLAAYGCIRASTGTVNCGSPLVLLPQPPKSKHDELLVGGAVGAHPPPPSAFPNLAQSPAPTHKPEPPPLTAPPPLQVPQADQKQTAPPSHNPHSDAKALLAASAKIDSLVRGSAGVSAPKTAKVGSPFDVHLRVSPGRLQELLGGLKQEYPDNQTLEGKDRIQLTPRMSASVRGFGFDISPAESQVQAVSGRETTTWTWQVNPTRSGALKLDFRLAGTLTIEGKDVERDFYEYEQPVTVKVSPVGFLESNWQWFAGVAGTGLTGLWGFYRLRRGDGHESPGAARRRRRDQRRLAQHDEHATMHL